MDRTFQKKDERYGNGKRDAIQKIKTHIFADTGFLSSVFATFAHSFGFTSPDSVGEE